MHQLLNSPEIADRLRKVQIRIRRLGGSSTRLGSAEHAGPVQRMRSNLIWGFESMPVTLGRRG